MKELFFLCLLLLGSIGFLIFAKINSEPPIAKQEQMYYDTYVIVCQGKRKVLENVVDYYTEGNLFWVILANRAKIAYDVKLNCEMHKQY